MVAWTGLVAVKMERNRIIEQIIKRHLSFNHSYKIWYSLYS